MPDGAFCQSPLDDRYYAEDMAALTSRAGLTRSMLDFEIALAGTWQGLGFCSSGVVSQIEAATNVATMAQFDAMEQITDHDIAAMVKILQDLVEPEAKPIVHRGATSFDARSSAEAARAKAAVLRIILPEAILLERELIVLALCEKETRQIGRTHGVHAEPITFGFYLTEFVDRIGDSLLSLENLTQQLVGKCSGPVGAFNQTSLYVPDPIGFEQAVMRKMGLRCARKSTQITPPEPMARLLNECLLLLGTVANLAWDLWHLHQTEIAEVMEGFKEGQVGSSGMPHKQNPKNCENVVSLWKAAMPRMTTVYADLISLHQRDLSNSASARFYTEVFAILYSAIGRMRKILGSLFIDRDRMRENLYLMGDKVLSGALHQYLANYGCPNSHKHAQRLSLQVGRGEIGKLLRLAQEDTEIAPYVAQFKPHELQLLSDPANYIGLSVQVTESVCGVWSEEADQLEQRLKDAGSTKEAA